MGELNNKLDHALDFLMDIMGLYYGMLQKESGSWLSGSRACTRLVYCYTNYGVFSENCLSPYVN